MALIPVKIIYNDQGSDTIEFEDSLTFGETESLISGSVDLSPILLNLKLIYQNIE